LARFSKRKWGLAGGGAGRVTVKEGGPQQGAKKKG